jgi:hypothetical protein
MKRDLNHEFGDNNADDDGERVHPRYSPVTVNGVTYSYKNMDRYRALRGAGLCAMCGKSPATATYCDPCKALVKAGWKRRYELKKAMGKCTKCNTKAIPGTVLCTKHTTYVKKKRK